MCDFIWNSPLFKIFIVLSLPNSYWIYPGSEKNLPSFRGAKTDTWDLSCQGLSFHNAIWRPCYTDIFKYRKYKYKKNHNLRSLLNLKTEIS